MTSKNKHLSLSERIIIESLLNQKENFKFISYQLDRNNSTISKEIKLNRVHHITTTFNNSKYHCQFLDSCKKQNKVCSACRDYKEYLCPILSKPPYVCNGCDKKAHCKKAKFLYRALDANNSYKLRLRESREGINLSIIEIENLDKLLAERVSKGQSLSTIYMDKDLDIPCVLTSLYNYTDKGYFSFSNMDMPRLMRYKARKKDKNYVNNRKAKIGKLYKDFLKYIADNPDVPVVEMDTVEGIKGENEKVLLTMIFRNCNLMLIFSLEHQTQTNVISQFDEIEKIIGYKMFAKFFPIILTDNGSEFSDPDAMENSCLCDKKRSKIFYCNPGASFEKGKIEKNHEFIRYIIPKGISMNYLTKENTLLMSNHINSVPRKKLNNHSPFELAKIYLGNDFLNLLHLEQIPQKNIVLKPKLLKHLK